MLEWGEGGGVSLSPTADVQSVKPREGKKGGRREEWRKGERIVEEKGYNRRPDNAKQNLPAYIQVQSSPMQAWVSPPKRYVV